MQIGDRIVKGIIKEKEEAQKEYNENLKAGNTVAYAAQSDSMKDVMIMKLGNILPNQTIDVRFSFIE